MTMNRQDSATHSENSTDTQYDRYESFKYLGALIYRSWRLCYERTIITIHRISCSQGQYLHFSLILQTTYRWRICWKICSISKHENARRARFSQDDSWHTHQWIISAYHTSAWSGIIYGWCDQDYRAAEERVSHSGKFSKYHQSDYQRASNEWRSSLQTWL